MAQKVFAKQTFPLMGSYDAQRFHPKDLKPDPVLNGRVKLPDIEKFKADFLNPAVGQIQPITIGKIDGYPVIIDGTSRWRAALEISNEGTGPHEGGAFFLKCQYSPAKSAFERYTLTIKANIRNEPTPEDDAHSIAIFLHTFGQTEEFVAEHIYGRFTLDGKPDVAWIRERNALNDLTPEAVDALKTGRLKSKAAVALAKLTPEKQREKLAAVPIGKALTVAAIKRADPVAAPGSTSDAPAEAPAKRKWQKTDFCDKLQEWIDMQLPPHILKMDVENAVRTVLGEIQDEMECGQ